MFASGVPTAEKPQAKRFYLMSHGPTSSNAQAWANYKTYLKRTSILVPREHFLVHSWIAYFIFLTLLSSVPPALYSHLPGILKRTLLFDFPWYAFREERDGAAAIEEERAKMA